MVVITSTDLKKCVNVRTALLTTKQKIKKTKCSIVKYAGPQFLLAEIFSISILNLCRLATDGIHEVLEGMVQYFADGHETKSHGKSKKASSIAYECNCCNCFVSDNLCVEWISNV